MSARTIIEAASPGMKILATQEFPADQAKAAERWCQQQIQSMAKLYTEEGAEIFYGSEARMSFATGGGDRVQARWDWNDVDDMSSPITAKVEGRDF